MWTCKVCGTEVEEDHFDACWFCAAPRQATDAEVAALRESWQGVTGPASNRPALTWPRRTTCVDCGEPMEFAGTRSFNVGSRVRPFGSLSNGVDPDFDLYICPSCGRVAFYVTGFER